MSGKSVIIYWSSATSDLTMKKNQMSCKDLFEKKGAKFDMVDLATMEKADRDVLFEKSGGNRTIPLVFIDGEYKGTYEHMQDLEEGDELAAVLGL